MTYGICRFITAQARSARAAATTHSALRWSAPRHHLGVVDPGQLRVLPAGGVRGPDQGGPQQRRSGLAHRLALAVGDTGLGRLRGQAGEGLERGTGREPARSSHRSDQGRPADRRDAGQRPRQPTRIGEPVSVLAFGRVDGEHRFQGTVGLPSPHVHGVAVNPGDGRVYLATHHGLFRYDDTGPTRVGPVIDLMGFTIAGPDRFYASGHPGEGSDLPNPVGLLESRDAGLTWSQLSRQGQSDFHALAASPSGVVGSDGALRASPDGRQWRDLQIAALPTALAASPDGHTVLAATDAGMLRSDDAGLTWAAPPGAPPLKVLSWAADGTAVGATFDGAVHVSTDAGATWQRRGRTPPPQAITATAADGMRVLVVTDENVLDSADGGTTFTPLQSHGR